MPHLESLSPSRANTFTACPRRYRYRYVDRLPEALDAALVRGTLVHLVCEHLLALAPAERTREAATRLLHERWSVLADELPGVAALFGDAGARARWLASADDLLQVWLGLEDLPGLSVAARELWLEHDLGGLSLRGILDRLDTLENGSPAIVDYKTSAAPDERRALRPFFQLRWYAFLLWRTRGAVPSLLRLVYLGGGGTILEHPCDEDYLRRFESRLSPLVTAIERAHADDRFLPRSGPACRRCPFADRCPAAAARPPPASAR